MFIKRSELKDLISRLKELEREKTWFVTCEKCACLLLSWKAHKGKGEIKRRNVSEWSSEEYIYHPYYCNVHKPKEDK